MAIISLLNLSTSSANCRSLSGVDTETVLRVSAVSVLGGACGTCGLVSWPLVLATCVGPESEVICGVRGDSVSESG